MTNDKYIWTYDEYVEWDREYKDVEYLLDKYDVKHNYKEYVEHKYIKNK